MAPVKRFLAMPDLRYHYPGLISLGDIIEDPTDPTSLLSRVESPYAALYSYDTHIDLDFEHMTTSKSSLGGSTWARLLAFQGTVSFSACYAKNCTEVYTADSLETVYLLPGVPNKAEITRRIRANPEIIDVMRSRLLRRTPVYMVTALKIAQGLKMDIYYGKDVRVGGSGGGTVGTKGNLSSEEAEATSCRPTGNLIFAYQLHVIREKRARVGDGDADVSYRPYKPSRAFLGTNGDSDEEDIEVEITGDVGADELREFDGGLDVNVMDGEGEVKEDRLGSQLPCLIQPLEQSEDENADDTISSDVCDTLYNVFVNYCQVDTGSEPPGYPAWRFHGKLGLSFKLVKPDAVFDAVFMKNPIRTPGESIRWQQVQFSSPGRSRRCNSLEE
jgi:hypothetical protein